MPEFWEIYQSFNIDGSTDKFSFSLSKTGTFTDSRDGKTYKYVAIGDQIWMAENLNYKTANSWCYDNNNSKCNTYGRLYNWEAAIQACPSGWHLPSDDDWEQLIDFLGGEVSAGGRMKETGISHWKSPNRKATNSSGFSALPGGTSHLSGAFSNLKRYAIFWSSSERGVKLVWNRSLFSNLNHVMRNSYGETPGRSVRCIRDN